MNHLSHMEKYNKSILNEFWEIAWPSSLEGLLLVLLSAIDLIMVSSLGVEATSAVGVFSQPKMVILCIPRSFSVAVTAYISGMYGQKKFDCIKEGMKQSFIISVFISFLIILFVIIFIEEILFIAGADVEYINEAISYGKCIAISLYFNSISIVLHSGFMGIGNSKIMMISNILGNMINIFVNGLLIHGIWFFPKLGVTGAGIGTCIGSFITLVFTLYIMEIKNKYLNFLRFGKWKINKNILKSFFNMFTGVFVEQSAERTGMFIYSRMVASLGTLPFAVHTICMNLCDLYYSFAQGMGKASLVLSSRYTAKKNNDNIKGLIIESVKLGTVFSFIAFLIYIIFGENMIGIYNTDTNVISLGKKIIIFVAVVSFPEMLAMIFSGVLRGMNKFKYVATYSLISIAILRPIITWFLSYYIGLGLYGAWIALVIDQTMRCIFAFIGIKIR